eukprot:6181371-Pleurochrysis_carterae.AAC.1
MMQLSAVPVCCDQILGDIDLNPMAFMQKAMTKRILTSRIATSTSHRIFSLSATPSRPRAWVYTAVHAVCHII